MPFLKQQTQNLLCRFCAYYTQGEFYRFINRAGVISLKRSAPDFKPQVLILAREYYQEQLLNFPLDDRTDLNKLLRLQYANPEYSYQIISREEGRSQVNLWQFNNELPSAKILLPESYLLAKGLQNGQVLVQAPIHPSGKVQFVAPRYSGCVSAFKNSLLNNVELFSASVGINLQGTLDSAKSELASRLLAGITAASMQNLVRFVRFTQFNNKASLIKTLGLPVFGVCSVYLSLTSAWLMWQQHHLETQVIAEKAQLQQALTIQDTVLSQQDTLEQLQSFFAQQQPKAVVLLTLASLIEDAQISVLRYIDGRYVIIGKTNEPLKKGETLENESSTSEPAIYRATDFLEKLISLPGVRDARFDSAVRKSNNYETFTVSFELAHQQTLANTGNNSLAEQNNGNANVEAR